MKVVFVGPSDLFNPAQPDRFYTVFARKDGIDLSGVEIIATAFADLLTDRSPRPNGAFLLSATVSVPAALAAAIAYAAAAQMGLSREGAMPMVVQLPPALLIGLTAQYLVEPGRERRMSSAISYYLPKSIVKELAEGKVALEGQHDRLRYLLRDHI